MTRRCKVCGGEMAPGGKVRYKNPVTKRVKESPVWRCKKCGYRVIG